MIKPHGSQNVVATGSVLFNNTNGVPVGKVWVRANGTATLMFLNVATGATRPQVIGTASGAMSLIADEPREFDLTGENMTSALVTLGTATSVLLVWEI